MQAFGYEPQKSDKKMKTNDLTEPTFKNSGNLSVTTTPRRYNETSREVEDEGIFTNLEQSDGSSPALS